MKLILNSKCLPRVLAIGAGSFSLFLLSSEFATAASTTDTSLGTSAGLSITTGVDDTALGNFALKLTTTGADNTAVGSLALSSNVVGINNTALGYGALQSNTASLNTAVGRVALFANTSGSNNVALGSATLYANTTGNFNSGLGVQALRLNTTGSSNVAIGYQALYTNVSSGFNTAIGDGALYNSTGAGNIAIGEDGGFNLTSGINNICIGSQGVAGESNTIRIGTSGTQTDTYLTGFVHGDGSKLTNIQVPANGITNSMIAPGAVSYGDLKTVAAPVAGQTLTFNGSSLNWTPSPWALNGNIPYTVGNVGIGVSNPASKLVVAGGPSWTANGWLGSVELNSAAAICWEPDTSGVSFGLGHTNGAFLAFHTTSAPGTNATPATYDFMITDTGKIGIGTTSATAQVEIAGAQDALHITAPQPVFTMYDTTNSNARGAIQEVGGDMNIFTESYLIGNNTSAFLKLSNAGNVGIGSAQPVGKLEVVAQDAVRLIGYQPFLTIYDSSTGYARGRMQSANGAVSLQTESYITSANPYSFLVLTNNGTVGVGTQVPAANMEVHGTGITESAVSSVNERAVVSLNSNVSGTNRVWTMESGIFGTPGLFGIYERTSGRTGMTIDVTGLVTVTKLQITGGADLAEPFKVKEEKLEKGSVVVIDDAHPGSLKRSSSAYDTRVAGIVSGANGVNPGISLHQEGVMDGEQNVALSGRVYVLADTENGPIRPGDLLTTSALPGHAMKVTDHVKAQGAILGKAMSSLDDRDGMVLVLVTLQ